MTVQSNSPPLEFLHFIWTSPINPGLSTGTAIMRVIAPVTWSRALNSSTCRQVLPDPPSLPSLTICAPASTA